MQKRQKIFSLLQNLILLRDYPMHVSKENVFSTGIIPTNIASKFW